MARTTSRRLVKQSTGAAECCPRPGAIRSKATKPFAGFFWALGDETRLEMVGLLVAEGKELCVCELESHFDVAQPTVSHHLRILRQAGIVTSERRGTWVYYALDRRVLEKLSTFRALLAP